ncbi:hypothetical protein BC831DRAFT_43478 [Entophlyctis helioformis]|nr:hypothetical protein BC831DRAFT_43478 [Entophlyctis helioformis]
MPSLAFAVCWKPIRSISQLQAARTVFFFLGGMVGGVAGVSVSFCLRPVFGSDVWLWALLRCATSTAHLLVCRRRSRVVFFHVVVRKSGPTQDL